ncbi:MAG: hypothetical protein GY799_03455 [Desulfobulbaceae bacterium]|nr:hypothetical protein [Desulfobulbaceae bacterium]
MLTFIFTLAITFSLLLVTVVLLSYCKRRQNKTSHGLTGMCHESGGTMCGCCSSQLLARPAETVKKVRCAPSSKTI